MIRLPSTDDAHAPAPVLWRWHIPSPHPLARLAPFEPFLPLALAVAYVAVVLAMARALGPVVVAVLVFSPFAALQVLLAFTLLTWSVRAVRRHVDRSRRALLRDSRCASCAYSLHGAPHAADGLVTCPECTARWDLRPRGGAVVIRPFEAPPARRTPPSPPARPRANA
ncbi:MAG: hypothetical protein SFY69_13805 [Planctomycetota bacterium]|nr:hypothetical protein [Planctomycetota bacterium]